jgi:hypothetical protein
MPNLPNGGKMLENYTHIHEIRENTYIFATKMLNCSPPPPPQMFKFLFVA